MTEAGGEDSGTERESDMEDMSKFKPESRKEEGMLGEYKKRKDRIFKHITVQDKYVRLPDMEEEDSNKLTLYMEIDDLLLHAFICDEHFGYMANPGSKEPEHQFFFEEIR